jgi:hypothetical protein
VDSLVLVFGVIGWKVYCQETRVQHRELEESVSTLIEISEHLFEVVVKAFRDCLQLAMGLGEGKGCMAHVGWTGLSGDRCPKFAEWLE